MSGFPPSKWEVRYLKDMKSLACNAREDGAPAMAAYLAIRPSSGEEGHFRFALAGPDRIKLRFGIDQVLPSKRFAGMTAEAEMAIGDQIQLELNSVCSAWVDVVELVRSQDILIVDVNDEDVAEDFLTALDDYKRELVEKTGKGDTAGICLRWVLGTYGDDKNVQLIAQVIMWVYPKRKILL